MKHSLNKTLQAEASIPNPCPKECPKSSKPSECKVWKNIFLNIFFSYKFAVFLLIFHSMLSHWWHHFSTQWNTTLCKIWVLKRIMPYLTWILITGGFNLCFVVISVYLLKKINLPKMLFRNIFSWTLPDWHCLIILLSWSQDNAVYSDGKAYHEHSCLIVQVLILAALSLQGMNCLNRMKNAWVCFLKQLLCFLLCSSLLPSLFPPVNLKTKASL